MIYDKETGLYTECKDWHKFFSLIPRKSLNEKWLWGKCFRKRIYLNDGMNGTIFNHYLKANKEVFMFKMEHGI